jgi:hypothetical protein
LVTVIFTACSENRRKPASGGPRGGGGLPGCGPPKPKFKKKRFVDIMISKVLHDFGVSRNQLLKSADD